MNLDAVRRPDDTAELAVDGNSAHPDLGFHAAGGSDDEGGLGPDLPFDGTVDAQPLAERDLACDVDPFREEAEDLVWSPPSEFHSSLRFARARITQLV